MRKIVLFALALGLAPACLFAVDGVVLINQATVMAVGGFPYVISQPGSYKLSGNLTAPRNAEAISIRSPMVSLDLNGFTVSCTILLSSVATPPRDCVSSFDFCIVRNGIVTITEDVSLGTSNLVYRAVTLSFRSLVEDLIINGTATFSPNVLGLEVFTSSVVRNNIVIGNGQLGIVGIRCPSVVVGNFGSTWATGSTCSFAQNTSDAGLFP